MSDHDGLGPEGSYFEHKARREEEARRARGDAMFPVWITVLYLVLGFVFGLWHPGWLVFLTVPIHYMHFDSQWERLTNPVMVTLIYLALPLLLFLAEEDQEAWLIDACSYPVRSMQEPEDDRVLRGSRDAFVETLVFKTALIRYGPPDSDHAV